MVLFNYQRREITGKIVYYGPGLCGKTTNLQFIHDHVDPTDRGHMVSLATDADRTLFFDFMPVDAGYIKGMKIKFQFYTVPGQVHYNETRKLVLRGADAVVFVADSQRSLLDANIYSYENMIENLRENGLDYETIPLVIQYNKRDLSDVFSVDTLEEKLNPRHVPIFQAVAIKGTGVMETFREIGRLLLIDIGKKYRVEITAERKKQRPEKHVKGDTPTMSSPTETERVGMQGRAVSAQHAAGQSTPEESGAVTATAFEQSQNFDFGDELILDDGAQADSLLPDSLQMSAHLDPLSPDKDDNSCFVRTMDAESTAPPHTNDIATSRGSMTPVSTSVKGIEFKMDLKIILQRVKKIVEENIEIMEKQTKIMRAIEEIREDLSKLQKNP